MPKYLLQASYSAEGSRGLLKDGGSKRLSAARTLVESLGGKIESAYFAFGATDVMVICSAPATAASSTAARTMLSRSMRAGRPGRRRAPPGAPAPALSTVMVP